MSLEDERAAVTSPKAVTNSMTPGMKKALANIMRAAMWYCRNASTEHEKAATMSGMYDHAEPHATYHGGRRSKMCVMPLSRLKYSNTSAARGKQLF